MPPRSGWRGRKSRLAGRSRRSTPSSSIAAPRWPSKPASNTTSASRGTATTCTRSFRRIELINAIFETLTASLRQRGGQVLKFLGDGMLAIFPVVDATRNETCVQAIDAAAEAMEGVDRLNVERQKAGKPVAKVDLALHLGEVLYGNVGAVDRLDLP